MSASPRDNRDDTPTPPDRPPVVLLLGIVGDTTWRMFTPVLVLGAVGYWGDVTFHTKPWLTLAGVVVAAGIAGLLIRNQLRKGNA